jgi:hypothetical protein
VVLQPTCKTLMALWPTCKHLYIWHYICRVSVFWLCMDCKNSLVHSKGLTDYLNIYSWFISFDVIEIKKSVRLCSSFLQIQVLKLE